MAEHTDAEHQEAHDGVRTPPVKDGHLAASGSLDEKIESLQEGLNDRGISTGLDLHRRSVRGASQWFKENEAPVDRNEAVDNAVGAGMIDRTAAVKLKSGSGEGRVGRIVNKIKQAIPGIRR